MTIGRCMRLMSFVVILGGPAAGPATAQLDDPLPPGRVSEGTLSFDGHASVGDFTGSTAEVTGEMTGGGLQDVHGWVEAPVKSLDTGNRKRDRDLNKSMESDKYPAIRFELDRVTRSDSAQGTVRLEGRMTIHGVTREGGLPATVIPERGGLRVRSDFPLNLKDYKIGGLTKMLGMLKMQEQIEVHVDVTFVPR